VPGPCTPRSAALALALAPLAWRLFGAAYAAEMAAAAQDPAQALAAEGLAVPAAGA
jgi:hypothetical protein